MNAFLRVPIPPSSQALPTILHAYMIPSTLNTDELTIRCETNYPFAPCATLYSISTVQSFDFFIRVPGWATPSSTIEFGEKTTSAPHSEQFIPNVDDPSFASLHRIQIPPSQNFKISVTLRADVDIQYHADKSISISYGPLLFAHTIDFEETTRLPRNHKDQISHCAEVANFEGDEDWKTRVRDHDLLPTSPWNVAIDPTKEMKLISEDPWMDAAKSRIRELPNPVWSKSSSPVYIEASVIEVDWPVKNGTAADPKDVDTSAAGVRGRPFRTKLAPYGTAKLHIAQFPTVNL